jgi:hypothetical protein
MIFDGLPGPNLGTARKIEARQDLSHTWFPGNSNVGRIPCNSCKHPHPGT